MADEYADQRTRVVAFYSYPAGLGCSGLVANVALILGSWGYRVLAVDRDFADPSLYRYLSALLPEPSDGFATTPVRLNCQFTDPRGAVALIGPATAAAATPPGFTVRRADLMDAGYDFVLVDLPASTGSVPLIGELADTLVLGYSLNKWGMTKVTADVQAVLDRENGDAIHVLPVPMRVDREAGSAIERMLVTGRLQFSWLLGDWPEARRQSYLAEAWIPYEPDYTVDERLAFLDDSSAQRDRLVGAYARLAAEIAPGQRPAVRSAVTDETRARYRGTRPAAADDRAAITVLHAPADRYWAEWLVSELERLNLTANRQRIDQLEQNIRSGPELLVVSDAMLALPGRDGYLSSLASPPPDGQVRLAVSTDTATLPAGQFPAHGLIALAGLSEERAHAELASYYRVVGPRTAGYRRLRYPGTPGKDGSGLSNLPRRDSACYGRDDVIDQIRDYLTDRDMPSPLTLTGPPGVGKSDLALEYASRFASHYDLVFRIQAHSVNAVRAGLGALAARLPDVHPAGDPARSLLRYLHTHPSMPERWLLIYDGADTPGVLNGLLPEPGRGHVLVTARTAADPSDGFPVPPLAPDVASAMLADLVPGIPPVKAGQIAEALGSIPLALRLATGWINVVARQLFRSGMSPATVTSNATQEFIDQLTALSGELPPHDADPARMTVELLLQRLRAERRGAAALMLLQACAFLAPTGMSAQLLQSRGMLGQLIEVDPKFSDPVLINNVRSMLASYRLSVQGSSAQDPLCVHPRVREILRDRLSPAERTERASAVARMLASLAPLAIEDDVVGYEIYAELLQHVETSGAPRQLDPEVRRWLVNQVRYLWQLGTSTSLHEAANLGERLARHWSAALADRDDDPLLLRLRTQLGNVYRTLSKYDLARSTDLDVLHRQRRLLGVTHPRTLMTARSYGADLRLTGEFDAALNEDQSTWRAFRDTLGDDHLLTVRASDNLALSELLCGYPELALQRQQEDIGRAERLRSEQPQQKPWVLFHVGTLQREIGRYEDSRRSLDEAKYDFDNLVAEGRLAPTLWVVLRTTAGLASTERRLGNPDPDVTRAVLNACRETYGQDPDVLSLEMSLAGDLHATGRHQEAVALADNVRQRCGGIFGDSHPFTRICEVNLSRYALDAGQGQLADAMSERGLSGLEASLNAEHPWVQVARVARANVHAVTGHPADALALEELVLSEYRKRFRPGNPLLRTVAINHANTRVLLNQPGALPDSETGMQRRGSIEIDFPPY